MPSGTWVDLLLMRNEAAGKTCYDDIHAAGTTLANRVAAISLAASRQFTSRPAGLCTCCCALFHVLWQPLSGVSVTALSIVELETCLVVSLAMPTTVQQPSKAALLSSPPHY